MTHLLSFTWSVLPEKKKRKASVFDWHRLFTVYFRLCNRKNIPFIQGKFVYKKAKALNTHLRLDYSYLINKDKLIKDDIISQINDRHKKDKQSDHNHSWYVSSNSKKISK